MTDTISRAANLNLRVVWTSAHEDDATQSTQVSAADDANFESSERALRWDEVSVAWVDDRKRSRRELRSENARRARVRDRSMRRGDGARAGA